jgi:hypothetical protein
LAASQSPVPVPEPYHCRKTRPIYFRQTERNLIPSLDSALPSASRVLFITYPSGIFDKGERAVPGVRGLSFVDDFAWWAEVKDNQEVAGKLSEAAAASLEWTANHGVVFDHGKTVGDKEISFNKVATCWLGVWLDSQLTLKEHRAVRLESGRNTITRLRRLTGLMGLSPVNCRKFMTSCTQSVAMFGAEL